MMQVHLVAKMLHGNLYQIYLRVHTLGIAFHNSFVDIYLRTKEFVALGKCHR